MNPYILTIIIVMNLAMLYFSFRKLDRKDFKKIIHSVDEKNYDFEAIIKAHQNDKKYKVIELDPNNIIIDKKQSFFNSPCAYMLIKNNGKVDIYFHERNIARRLFSSQWYDTEYLLIRDKLLD